MRRGLAVLAALVLATSLTACGTGNDKESSGGGDTLRFAGYGPPIRSWDPHRDGRMASNLLLFAVYDRLIGQDPDGNLVPQLAKEWEFTDPTTLSMTLREGTQFSDGTAFDGAAVKANIERAQTIDEGTGPWAGPLGVIKQVEVVDATHVKLHLNGPAASLPTLLSDAAGAMISPAAFDTDLNQKPVGAGMYTLTKWTADGSASFAANAEYWDPAAVGPKKIEMPFQLDQLRRLDMFKANEVDATFGHTSFVDGAKQSGLDVEGKVGINFWMMDLNRSQKPFDDAKVRQAINYSLDRDAMVKALLYGEADANQQPFNEESLGFNKALGKSPYATDNAKAKSLLEEAGYGDGVSFDCAIIAGSGGAYSAYAEVIKEQLAKSGITLNIKLVESQSSALLVDKSVNCAILPYGALSPIVTAQQLFGADGYYNAGKEADEETKKFLAALNEPQSDADLSSDFDALMQKVNDDALFTGLFFEKWAVLSHQDVSDLQFWLGGQYTEFRGISMK